MPPAAPRSGRRVGSTSGEGSGRLAPYDAVLLLSFGGPERPDDVLPVPAERHPRPGHPARAAARRSPSTTSASAAAARSTTRTAQLLAALRAELRGPRAGPPACYWGNRNWDPVPDRRAARRRRRRGTAASPCWSPAPYSSLLRLPAVPRGPRPPRWPPLGEAGAAAEVDKIRHYFNHPGFVAPMADAVAALAASPAARPRRGAAGLRHALGARLRWTRRRGPAGGAATSAQHRGRRREPC